MSPTKNEEVAWVAQWKNAARELADQRVCELEALTEADSVRMFNDLDSPPPAPLPATSGLVIQQTIFHRSSKRPA